MGDKRGWWEQSEVQEKIPLYRITLDLEGKNTEGVLNVRGDEHLGVIPLDIPEMISVFKNEQEKYAGRILVLEPGDWIENGHKSSIGHNYDLAISDPADQVNICKEIQIDLDKNLYGSSYSSMEPCLKTNHAHTRRVAVLGNHEYRDRRETGKWLNRDLFASKGVLDAGIHCLLLVTVQNKSLGLRKKYRIWMAHRLTNSAASVGYSTLLRNFAKKKADISADIYVCGHYHRRTLLSDVKYGPDGKKRKVLYAVCPSPVENTEYAVWAQYSPTRSSYFINIFLPIEAHKDAYGYV